MNVTVIDVHMLMLTFISKHCFALVKLHEPTLCLDLFLTSSPAQAWIYQELVTVLHDEAFFIAVKSGDCAKKRPPLTFGVLGLMC